MQVIFLVHPFFPQLLFHSHQPMSFYARAGTCTSCLAVTAAFDLQPRHMPHVKLTSK